MIVGKLPESLHDGMFKYDVEREVKVYLEKMRV
jgi:hypothetical protein